MHYIITIQANNITATLSGLNETETIKAATGIVSTLSNFTTTEEVEDEILPTEIDIAVGIIDTIKK